MGGPPVLVLTRRAARVGAGLFAAGLLAGCGGAHVVARASGSPRTADSTGSTAVPTPGSTRSGAVPVPTPAATAARSLPGSLRGQVIVLDPGHNPNDAQHLAQVDALVDVITERKPCDAIGASTDSGYPESLFTYDVAIRTAAILRARGATVILTRNPSTPYGPCVTTRAEIGNAAHATASVAIHADGGPPSGIGFQVIRPGPVGPNDGMIAASDRLATALHTAFHAATGEPYADYLGGGSGYTTRTDLGGLNLSTVPKVFIECANMRNPTDATRVTSAAWRQRAAEGIADGITVYLDHA